MACTGFVLLASLLFGAPLYAVFRGHGSSKEWSELALILTIVVGSLAVLGTGYTLVWLMRWAGEDVPGSDIEGIGFATIVTVLLVVVAVTNGLAYKDLAPESTPRVTRIERTTVVAIGGGEITYVVEREAAGGDTIGYGDADFITISVDPAGQCYAEAELVRGLPQSCADEVR